MKIKACFQNLACGFRALVAAGIPACRRAGLPSPAEKTSRNQECVEFFVGRKTMHAASGRQAGMPAATLLKIALILVISFVRHAAWSALPRSTPEAQGVSSAAILDFVQSADKLVDAMNSFMLVRHGHVVADGWWSPYAPDIPHSMYSLSKSFTSTGVGLAIAEGKLSLDDQVLKFFPDQAPANPSANLKEMRVRDLLRMSTGQHATDMTNFSFDSTEPLPKLFLSIPVAHKPGTHFWYNTPATFMCSAIVQKATGQTLFDYLKPRLFEPLGIENSTWEMKQQYTYGGSGLHIRTEDIATFGQLYLQKGKWNGKQLVPESWVTAATSLQTANGSNPDSDWDQGYGYFFWRCRPGCYRGDGAFGQFCIVIPQQDAVVAITSGTRDMQGVLNLVWRKLLPAMRTGPLPANDASDQELKQTLAGLTMHPETGAADPSAAVMDCSGKKYTFPENKQKIESAALEFDKAGKSVTLVTRCNGMEQHVACGDGDWIKGRMTYAEFEEQPVAASGEWTTDDTYTVKLLFYETPYCLTLNFKFSSGQLLYDCEYNVNFGPTKQPQLVGKPE